MSKDRTPGLIIPPPKDRKGSVPTRDRRRLALDRASMKQSLGNRPLARIDRRPLYFFASKHNLLRAQGPSDRRTSLPCGRQISTSLPQCQKPDRVLFSLSNVETLSLLYWMSDTICYERKACLHGSHFLGHPPQNVRRLRTRSVSLDLPNPPCTTFGRNTSKVAWSPRIVSWA